MPITVKKNEQGLWLQFKSSTGKSAMVHIQKLIPIGGSIISNAIIETCMEECAKKKEN